MIHANADLARRLEAVICEEWRRLARTAAGLWPERRPAALDVAGGVALWLGEGSLVNVAAGLAMDGPIGESELRRVEDFYAIRGAPPILTTCAFADPTLFMLLGRRRWQITEFENVLALELPRDAVQPTGEAGPSPTPLSAAFGLPSGLEVRTCEGDDRALWGRMAARGFSDGEQPGPGHEEFGALMAAREDAILVLAWVEGKPAGTGNLVIADGVAWLSGDSTLPEYRGRGVQQAIQRFRLELAGSAGCRLAVTESAPGSGSQRNMERLGFRVVYTHLEFVKV